LIYFDLFWSFRSISIHFDPFRSISIYFDSFQFRHQNRQHILMACRPFLSFHHLTAKMVHDGCCCHLTFASFTRIMQEYDISWLIWRFSDGSKSGKTTINQWEGRVILQCRMKKRCGPIYAFLCTYYLLGSL
jgi:hypothetical protein